MSQRTEQTYNPGPVPETLELVNRLSIDGTLNRLFHAGLISGKVFVHRDMYYKYDALRKMGLPCMQAMEETAEYFGVCDKTVYRAIRSMRRL